MNRRLWLCVLTLFSSAAFVSDTRAVPVFAGSSDPGAPTGLGTASQSKRVLLLAYLYPHKTESLAVADTSDESGSSSLVFVVDAPATPSSCLCSSTESPTQLIEKGSGDQRTPSDDRAAVPRDRHRSNGLRWAPDGPGLAAHQLSTSVSIRPDSEWMRSRPSRWANGSNPTRIFRPPRFLSSLETVRLNCAHEYL
jgi:hypothetical protein